MNARRLTTLLAGLTLAACGTTVPVTSQVAAGSSGLGPGGVSGQPPGTTGSPSLDGASTGLVTGGSSDVAGSRPGQVSAPTSASSGAGAPRMSTGGGSLAAKGPGWDQRNLYLGFTSQEDLSTALKGLGVSFDPGSIQADVKAFVRYLNAHGGVLGHQIVPVFRDHPSAESADAGASATCAAFTQDNHVAAVVNGVAPIETQAFLECMRKTATPLVSTGYSTYDDATYRKYGPYVVTDVVPSMTSFVPGFVPMLESAGYLTGWDATTGSPSKAPVVVGILEPDTPAGHSAAGLQATAFKRAEVGIATYFYREDPSTYSSDMSAAILQFRQAHVTHMTDITNTDTGILFFAQTAQQQRFYPRWAVTSWELPATAAQVLAQGGMSKQLNGAVGVGWTPGGDVDDPQDPGRTGSQARCDTAMKQAGIDHSASDKRTARYVAWALCDAIDVTVNGFVAAHAFGAPAFRQGLALSGQSFRPAATFASGLSGSAPWVPNTFRVLVYDNACTCFSYRGATRRF